MFRTRDWHGVRYVFTRGVRPGPRRRAASVAHMLRHHALGDPRMVRTIASTLVAGVALVLLGGFVSIDHVDVTPSSSRGQQVAWADVKVGMCSDFGNGAVQNTITVVDCNQPHRGEFYWVGSLPAGPFPGATAADDAVSKICNEKLPPGPIDWFTSFSPSQAAWESGNRRSYCLATKEHQVSYTGSLASLWSTPWEPLYWIDGALALAMVATYLMGAARVRRMGQTRPAAAVWASELWWFILPVAGVGLAFLFPNGTRHYSGQSALPFPVSVTLWFSVMTLIGVAGLIQRVSSMRRLDLAARTHPGALVLEGVRLYPTLTRLRALLDDGAQAPAERGTRHRGTKIRLPFWFPLVVTGSGVSITTTDGKSISLERDNIQSITTEYTSVDVGSGHTRSASLIDVRLSDPDLVVPLAVRSTRWNAFFRLTANAQDTAAVRNELSERLESPAAEGTATH